MIVFKDAEISRILHIRTDTNAGQAQNPSQGHKVRRLPLPMFEVFMHVVAALCGSRHWPCLWRWKEKLSSQILVIMLFDNMWTWETGNRIECVQNERSTGKEKVFHVPLSFSKDNISYNTSITACERASRATLAAQLVSEMRDVSIEADLVTYNASITSCEKLEPSKWFKFVVGCDTTPFGQGNRPNSKHAMSLVWFLLIGPCGSCPC